MPKQQRDFVYVFPRDLNVDASGRATLAWAPGVSPFGTRLSVSESNALQTIRLRPNALTTEECRAVIEHGERLQRMDGRVELGPEQYRVSHIAWIEPREETHWLFHRLGVLFAETNRHYGFDLVGFIEALQYTVYGPEQHFDWHMDLGPDQTSARKLSVTIQLSASGDYGGGRLEFLNAPSPDESRQIGAATFFPSYLAHRVSPVTSGVRRSLVAWACGAAFR